MEGSRPAQENGKKAYTSPPSHPPVTQSGFSHAADGSRDVTWSSQRQLLQLLSIIEDGSESLKERTTIVEARVEMEELEEEHYFVKRARKVHAEDLSGPSQDVFPRPTPSFPPIIGDDLGQKARDFLFGQPYKIGRLFTPSGSVSGTGWIPEVPFVVTCAHVVNMAGTEELFFQLPDNVTTLSVDKIFSRAEGECARHYQRDVALLKMTSVVGSKKSVMSLPLAGISAGCLDWTCKCVCAGILAPVSSEAPNESQKMINCGIVESQSSQLVTSSARADKGFSGGPLLNKNMDIIGMIQGDHGSVIKTVKIIPIMEVSNVLSIVSQFIPDIPLIPLPMAVSGSSTF